KTLPVSGIDTVAGATVSSNAIIDAVNTVEIAAPAVGTDYAVKGAGLTGTIDIVVTMGADNTIQKVAVNGTDSAMDESFVAKCDEAFLAQFVGKTIPVSGIDTVAGATVSSNAIIDAVNTVVVEAPAAEEVKGTEYRVSGQGFTGTINVMVTVAEDGTIQKVAILGTDSEYDEAFVGMCDKDAFLGQFVGKTTPVSGIDTVAGATASSNGIIEAVNKVVVEAPAAEEAKGTEYRVSGQGFTGTINVMVTVAEDGTIQKVAIMGTDSEYDEAFVGMCDKDAFLGQFVGKTIPVDGIDTVAGATASSKGIIEAVNKVVVGDQAK
ncbi:MAG: FMN-binding protein, partial [Clostridia bacterium]|nr:FMN-binding protein [Clostridia bacterium]